MSIKLPRVTTYAVPMWPRNTTRAPIHVLVEADSPEQAVEKALAKKPGHAWGRAEEVETNGD
jgi:hypothetical protein